MVRRESRGFTLIELLIVLGIIVLLMAILMPGIQAVIRAVQVTEARRRIDLVYRTVNEYRHCYDALPPDRSPNLNMKPESGYPPHTYVDGVRATYLFDQHNAFGGKFLAYFLMGPGGRGWHRPKSTNSNDPDYPNRGIAAEWDMPETLVDIWDNSPVYQGSDNEVCGPVFTDGLGLANRNGGVIAYLKKDPLPGKAGEWRGLNDGPIGTAFYWDCRTYYGTWGDALGSEHAKRILDACPYDFALLSAGPDRKYGFRVTIMEGQGEERRGTFAQLDFGLTDDIANYPLK